MGGPGSGMWYRWDTRTTLDQVKRLDVRWLHRSGYLDHWPRWVTWSRGERQTGSIGVRLVDGCLVIEYHCRRRGMDTWEAIRLIQKHGKAHQCWPHARAAAPVGSWA